MFLSWATAGLPQTEPPGPETPDSENEEAREETLKDDGLISVNFQNANIAQVIKVLGDITETVIIPHPDLAGKITIVSLERVEPQVVANILESALMTRGFTLVKSGEALKVVPLTDTKQTNVAVRVGTSPDEVQDQDIVITQVMPLEYASAIKLKNTLEPLVGKYGNILANEVTNTLIVTDVSSNIKRLATIISQMERPVPAKIQVKTFILNYGDATKIAKILNDLSKEGKNVQLPLPVKELPQEDIPLELFGEVEAFAEEETNSIVVASAPVNLPAIERLVKKLDVFPPQAMIEVVIMDITLTDDFNAGIELGDPTDTTSSTTEGVKLDLFGGSKHGTTRESTFHSALGLVADAASRGFTYSILNSDETFSLLSFILSSQENSKVLSTPKILASNNKESTITVGQEIPIIQSSVYDATNQITTEDYEYQDIGMKLQVTPRISQDGYVNLQVHAELKDLSAQTIGISELSIINTREADATVLIPDGHTAVLAGLIRDNNSVVEHKIPLLGDIPFLGNLFKQTEINITKTELVLFLTPHIVKSIDDLNNMASKSKEKMKTVKEARGKKELKEAVQEVVEFKEPKKQTGKKVIKKKEK
jgi:general secretion pathway protein D